MAAWTTVTVTPGITAPRLIDDRAFERCRRALRGGGLGRADDAEADRQHAGTETM